MLHATIRCGESTVHFIGDVDEYNLETLVDHARYGLAHGESVSMRVEIDSGDHETFLARSQRWMRRLTRSGVHIDVAVSADSRERPTTTLQMGLPLSRRRDVVGH
jgi:hypothetical protein